MATSKVYWLAVFAVVLGGAAPAFASLAPAARCGLGEYSAFSVSPLRTDENFGLGNYTVLKGAQFYVAAKPGLTAEWLTVIVQRELARLQMDADQACRPNVRNVQVSVAPAGGGFWVFLSAPDARSAARLLSWAKYIETARPAAVQ